MTIELSADQLRAVETTSSAVLVVAPAGSGKTEVVAQRLERLLSDGDPDGPRALAMTYTVKAADELRDRLRLRLGDLARRVDAETTHSFAMDLLRRHGTRIGLPREPEVLSRDVDRADLLQEWLTESGQQPPRDLRQALETIDLARARREEAPLVDDFRAALLDRGAVDYPSMLEHAIDLLTTPWLRRQLSNLYLDIVVDEAQNLTRAQYTLLTRLLGEPSGDHIHAMLVGDERQALAGFGGADASLIREFETTYAAERIELTANFRSAARIVAAGHQVAAKLAIAASADGNQTYPAAGSITFRELSNETEEADGVASWVESQLREGLDPDILAPGEAPSVRATDIAVLARTAAALRRTQAALEAREIPIAVSVSPDDWVRSAAARLTTEVIGYLAAPSHRSVRRVIAGLCQADVYWTNLAIVITASEHPDIREMKGLCDLAEVDDLLPYLESVSIADEDWDDDLNQFRQVWESFADRYGPADRSFANLRQHIARSQRGDILTAGVRLLTVHKAQGRAFKSVALVACNDGQLPDFRAETDQQRTDELRIFYVAVTRPSRALLLTRAAARDTRYGPRRTQRSPYVDLVLGSGS